MTIWVKNIAKLLGLLAALLLLAGPRYAHAQNTAAGPYFDSWHKYQVEGVVSTSYDWYLFNTPDDANNFTNGTLLVNTLDWVEGVDMQGGIATVEIYFDRAGFTLDPSVHLVFSEYSLLDGACTARRLFNINITDNTFYLTLGDNFATCNTNQGRVFNWDDIDTEPLESYIDFTVQVNKATDFVINDWNFTAQLSFSGAYALSANDPVITSGNGGAVSFTYRVAENEIDVEVTAVDPNPLAELYDVVTVRIYITGLVHQGETVQLQLEAGSSYAQSGDTDKYVVRTDDDVGKGGGDRTQVITVQPLPATTNIAVVD